MRHNVWLDGADYSYGKPKNYQGEDDLGDSHKMWTSQSKLSNLPQPGSANGWTAADRAKITNEHIIHQMKTHLF